MNGYVPENIWNSCVITQHCLKGPSFTSHKLISKFALIFPNVAQSTYNTSHVCHWNNGNL